MIFNGAELEQIIKAMFLNEEEIANRKAFLNFSFADIEILKSIHEKLDDLGENFVSSFYKHLLSFSGPAKFFSDDVVLEKLKQTQKKYFSQLTEGEYGEKYVTDRLYVGFMHHHVKLEPKWYVGAYCFYLVSLIPRIWSSCNKDYQKFAQSFSSLLKIVLFDMTIALDTYFYLDKEELKRLTHYAAKIVEEMPIGIVIFNKDLEIISYNHALKNIFLFSDMHESVKIVTDLPVPDAVKTVFIEAAQGHSVPPIIQIKAGSGLTEKHLELRTLNFKENNKNVFFTVIQDITESSVFESRMEYAATHDYLTGMPNRSALQNRISQNLTANPRKPFSVIFLDVDNFKSINDTYGHDIGDELIKIIAQRILSSLKRKDFSARIGGDEFVILLHDLEDHVIIKKIIKRLDKNIMQPINLVNHIFVPRLSMGVSSYPKDGDNLVGLLKSADTAMYGAKDEGGNTFKFYTGALTKKITEKMTILEALHTAVAKNDFFLLYQPQYDLKSGNIDGLEALIRLRTGGGQMINPSVFIPIAEEYKIMIPIFNWVIKEACLQAKAFYEKGFSLKISVNLSASQLNRDGFVAYVTKILQEISLPANLLEFEITESILIKDVKINLITLNSFKNMGILLALDDFGIQFSSVGYLSKFPFNTVKIDKSFVDEIGVKESYKAIIPSIIHLAHGLNMKVIAEGVETKEQYQFLKEHECDAIQGFYLAKPMHMHEIEPLLQLEALRKTIDKKD
jgi:diguanylate cyclase (GGDEF)-like protein